MPSDKNRRPELLSGAGGLADVRVGDPSPIERSPLTYAPRSTTRVNVERLPHAEELRGMELAYREEPESLEVLARETYTRVLPLMYVSLTALIVLGVLRPRLGAGTALALAGVVGFGLGVWRLIRRDFTPTSLVLWIAAPVLIAAGLYLAPADSRLWTGGAFTGATLILFSVLGTDPPHFYREYLLAHPRLRPETRRARLAESASALRADVPLLTLLLVGALAISLVSPALALVFVCGVSAWKAMPLRGEPISLFREVVPRFFAYGQASSGAPGVWKPSESLERRRAVVFALSCALFLTLAVTLSLFFPWDILRPAISRHYAEGALPSVYAQLEREPWTWTLFVIDKLLAGELVYLLCFPAALLLSLVVPPLVVAAVYANGIRALSLLAVEIDSLDQDDRPEWQWYVDRVRGSAHVTTDPLGNTVRESEHLFLGVEPFKRFPVLLDEKVIAEHCYLVGESGAGKTSMGIMPILLQLLRGPAGRPPPPVLVLDLKGDRALFHTLRAEAAGRAWRDEGGREHPSQAFRYFTTTKGFSSHRFNPFSSFDPNRRTLLQLCQLVLDALDLNHGPGYGRSYYTAQSRHALALVLKNIQERASGEPVTFELIKDVLLDSRVVKPRDKKDAVHLIATIEALASYPQLLTTRALEDADAERAIHMPRLIEERQLVYFSLSAIQESITVREIGQLALFALVSAAIDRQNAGLPSRQVYLVIDEFQRIASGAFAVILEQARSFGISVILANQTQGALKTGDVDLRPTVRTNTRAKMFFAVSDPREVADLMESSGEELALMQSWSVPGFDPPQIGLTQQVKPRLTRNDIAAAGDHPLDFIAHISRGSGYTQFSGLPFLVRTTWPLPESLYRERAAAPWPPEEPGQVVQEEAPNSIDQRSSVEAGRLAEEVKLQQAAMEELAREIARATTAAAPTVAGVKKKPKEPRG